MGAVWAIGFLILLVLTGNAAGQGGGGGPGPANGAPSTFPMSWISYRGDNSNSGLKQGVTITPEGQEANSAQVSDEPIIAPLVLSSAVGMVYVVTVDMPGIVNAYSADCEIELMWSKTLDFSCARGPALDDAAGVLYVATVSSSAAIQAGSLWALNSSTGAPLMQWILPDPVSPSASCFVSSDLKLLNSTLYFGLSCTAATYFAALQVTKTAEGPLPYSGSLAWSCLTDGPVHQAAAISTLNTTLSNTNPGTWVYFLADNGAMHGVIEVPLSPSSGCPMVGRGPSLSGVYCSACASWYIGQSQLKGLVYSPPVVFNPTGTNQEYILLSTTGLISGVAGGLYSINSTDKSPTANVTVPTSLHFAFGLSTLALNTPPVVASFEPGQELVVVGSTSGVLLALNLTAVLNTSAPTIVRPSWWSSLTAGYPITSGPISSGQSIATGTTQGGVILVNGVDGSVAWSAQTSLIVSPSATTITKGMVFDQYGRIFVATLGEMGALSIFDGRCPTPQKTIIYLFIVISGTVTMASLMAFYCWKAFKERKRVHYFGPSMEFVDSILWHFNQTSSNGRPRPRYSTSTGSSDEPSRRSWFSWRHRDYTTLDERSDGSAARTQNAREQQLDINTVLPELGAEHVMTPRVRVGDLSTTLRTRR